MKITVLGSTGSIGRQSLDVADKQKYEITALTAGKNVVLMERQARKFRPKLAVMSDEKAARDLKTRLADTPVRVLGGESAICEAAAMEADRVLCAIVGMAALRPVLAAVDSGRRLALANKESLVCAGELIKRRAKITGAEIIPVDSEHSAIFQCLQGCRDRGEIKRLILTCSGGPFFGKSRAELERVTSADALKHPTWSMGDKITIDSATLMNKGLEFIEAMRLYSVRPDQIQVLIHRQSIIHSLVEYCDNAVLAQLGSPDMRLPIQYALTWPERLECPATALDLLACGPLSFDAPDLSAFPCLRIALETAPKGELACTVMNSANELAAGKFLKGEISFYGVSDMIERALALSTIKGEATPESIFEADMEVRSKLS